MNGMNHKAHAPGSQGCILSCSFFDSLKLVTIIKLLTLKCFSQLSVMVLCTFANLSLSLSLTLPIPLPQTHDAHTFDLVDTSFASISHGQTTTKRHHSEATASSLISNVSYYSSSPRKPATKKVKIELYRFSPASRSFAGALVSWLKSGFQR